MMNQPIFSPMQLGDIFDRTFRLFGRTFFRNVIILSIILIPVGFLCTVGVTLFYSSLGNRLATLGESADPGAAFELLSMRNFAMVVVGSGLFMLAAVAGKLAVTIVASKEMMQQRITWGEALEETMSIKLGRAAGQLLLEYLTYAGCFLAAMLVFAIAALIHETLALLTFLIMLPVCAFGVLYIALRWSQTIPVIANEHAFITQSFERSYKLTKKNMWRVLGILFLFTILTQFVVTIISTPITMIAMWKFYVEYFKFLSAASQGNVEPAMPATLLSKLGPSVGISVTLNLFLTTLLTPIYGVVLYFDLRARTGEFTPPLAEIPVMPPSVQPDLQPEMPTEIQPDIPAEPESTP